MKAFFFGNSSRQLFGVYHPPRASTARESGVLLCYPGAQEYNAAHWAFRKLAGMLARDGFHVLRFDWFATGDSAGDVEDGHPDVWLEDVETAASELRDSSAATSIAVVGMRLGAALAARACAEGRLETRDLILWEPVTLGTQYVAELEAQDERENFQLLHAVPRLRDELVGYRFPVRLRDALSAIDTSRTALPASTKCAIFGAVDRPDYRALQRALSKDGRDVSFHHVPEDAAVTNAGVRETALLSNRILVAMSEHLARRPREERVAREEPA